MSVPHGIFPRGLPFQDHSVDRPSFSNEARAFESFLLEVLAIRVGNDPGFFTEDSKEHATDRINDLVNHHTGYEGKYFGSSADCMEFLHQRRFLFEKRPEDNHYRNTGFGHRKIVVKFVNFIHQMNTPTGRCTLGDLEKFCQRKIESGEIEVYNDSWLKEEEPAPPWTDSHSFFKSVSIEEAVRKVIDFHPEIFRTQRGLFVVFVGLQGDAYNIPSLWNAELLPKKPVEPFFDKSRTNVFLAEISSSHYGYKGKIMEAIIADGHYNGRRIRIFDEFPTEDLSKIPLTFPVGTLVFVYAHMVLGCSYEFHGINIIPVPVGGIARNDRKRMEMVARGFLDEGKASYPPSTSDQSPSRRVQYVPLNELIAAEQLLIKFVDEFFGFRECVSGRDLLSREEILEGLQTLQNSDYEHLFRNTDDVLEFIEKRPHLYHSHQGKTGMQTPQNRDAYGQLFRYLDARTEGRPFHFISGRITAVDRDRLQILFGAIDPLLTVTKDPKKRRADLYSLKVHFDKTKNVLLPGYPTILPLFPDR